MPTGKCIFSTKYPGEAARAGTGAKCVFCDPSRMSQALATDGGKRSITRLLKRLAASDAVMQEALLRVPEGSFE